MTVSNQAVRPCPASLLNRRAVVRYRCDPSLPGRTFIIDSYLCLPARVVDLCPTGIGLLLAEWVELGTHVSIELDEGDRGQTVELQAEVAHATQQPDGAWRCAFRLHRALTDDELEVLSR